MTESANNSTRHGDRDINVKAILVAGIVFVVAAVAIHLGIWWMLRLMVDHARRQDPPKLNSTKELEPPRSFPKLQDGVATKSPADEMKAWKRVESERVVEYSWVDQSNGTVRIPVDEAMRIVLGEGLKSRDSATAGPESGAVAAAAASTEGGTR